VESKLEGSPVLAMVTGVNGLCAHSYLEISGSGSDVVVVGFQGGFSGDGQVSWHPSSASETRLPVVEVILFSTH